MTGETQLFTALNQIILTGRGMWIVTLYAATLGNHLMNTFRIGRYHWWMTYRTDLFGVDSQKLAVIGCMCIVATGAFIVFQRSMYELTCQFFLKRVVALHAKIAESPRLEPELFSVISCKKALYP